MSDFFLSLSRSQLARSVVKQTGIPIPMPQNLKRQRAPWSHGTLHGRKMAIGGAGIHATTAGHTEPTSVEGDLAALLLNAGAEISGDQSELNGILFDATEISSPGELKNLYDYFHPLTGKLLPCAHVLLVGRQRPSFPVAAATQEALSGFVRSLAKELGGRGITVNLIVLPPGESSSHHADISGLVRYFLSDHSSFVTGQVLLVSEPPPGAPPLKNQKFENLLEDKTILVTGAAHGIGAAIARRIASEGGKVLLLDRPQEVAALEAVAREIHGMPILIDLLQADAVTTTIKKLREMAPIHGVVHNAGITRDKTLFKMSPSKWESVLKLNFEIPIAITDMMMGPDHDYICAKDASFVFLSSVSGIAGNPGQTNYSAAKAGLIGYAEAMAYGGAQSFTSFLSQGRRERFNCVAPGFIETRMTEAMPLTVREVARRFNSLKQAGQPDDVAQAVAFLLSDASTCINGQTLRVCGQNMVGR